MDVPDFITNSAEGRAVFRTPALGEADEQQANTSVSKAIIPYSTVDSIQVGYSTNTFKTEFIEGLENIPFEKLQLMLAVCKSGTKDGSFFTRSPFINPSAKRKTDSNANPLSQVLIIDCDSTINIETGTLGDDLFCIMVSFNASLTGTGAPSFCIKIKGVSFEASFRGRYQARDQFIFS